MKKASFKAYETDASQIEGNAIKVIIPSTIGELERVVVGNKTITIRAGGSGFAGGAVPLGDVVLDVSKLDRILRFNKEKKTVVVESGVILDDLNDFLSEFNLEFPINPASHSICALGGMIATNAAGSRAVKFGKTSDWVLWLDVMNSQGLIERKNKSDLRDYAGMEGITGIIVGAGLKLVEKKERGVELIAIKKLEDLMRKVKEFKRSKEVSMVEFIDLEISKNLGLGENYHLIVEKEKDNISEGQKKESKRILTIRDSIGPLLSKKGNTILEDPKVLLDKVPLLIRWFEGKKIPIFGHIGYGILHPRFNNETEKYIPEMIKLVKRLGGQISGEHGIGILKKEFVDPNDKKLLINIKKRLDPTNKFNPGKII